MKTVSKVIFEKDPEYLQDVFDEIGDVTEEEWEKSSSRCFINKEVHLGDDDFKEFASNLRKQVEWIEEQDVKDSIRGMVNVIKVVSTKTQEFFYINIIKENGLLLRLVGLPHNHTEIMLGTLKR